MVSEEGGVVLHSLSQVFVVLRLLFYSAFIFTACKAVQLLPHLHHQVISSMLAYKVDNRHRQQRLHETYNARIDLNHYGNLCQLRLQYHQIDAAKGHITAHQVCSGCRHRVAEQCRAGGTAQSQEGGLGLGYGEAGALEDDFSVADRPREVVDVAN